MEGRINEEDEWLQKQGLCFSLQADSDERGNRKNTDQRQKFNNHQS